MLTIPFLGLTQNFPKSIHEIEIDYLKGKTEQAIHDLYRNISIYKTKAPNSKKLIESYNLLCEIYLTNHEIDLTLKTCNADLIVTTSLYGKEAIQLAEIYTLYSKYHSFLIHKDSAYYYSKKAIELCIGNKKKISSVAADKIYRQYAFASKIIKEDENYHKARILARKILDTALFYNKLLNDNDPIFRAQLLTDIGNTFTDEVLIYRINNNKIKSEECFIKANEFYDISIALNSEALGDKNYPLARNYYLKALSNIYLKHKKYNSSALRYLQKAMIANTKGFENNNDNDYPLFSEKFINSSLALLLYSNKVDEFYRNYLLTKDTLLLRYAYEHSKEAIKLWRKTLKNLNVSDVHLALEIYGNSPLIGAIRTTEIYFNASKNEELSKELIEWMDLIKYESILKAQLIKGEKNITENSFSIRDVQKQLHDKQCAVEFYSSENRVTISIIGKNFYCFIPGKEYLNLNKIDSLNNKLKKHQAKQFCYYSKKIYDSLFLPFLSYLPQGTNQLLFIPDGKLLEIPFDALILNNSNTYKNADFFVKHFETSQALSLRLWLGPQPQKIPRKVTIFNTEYSKNSSLPFNSDLKAYLKKSFAFQDFKLNSRQKDSGIFHISGHSYNDSKFSRLNGIFIDDSSRLNLNDISKLKLPFKLAVVSICQSAKGNIERGEGQINFNRHFYLAGIKSTISSLWKVDDEATASILHRFYSNLMNENSTSTSLHLAKLYYLENVKSIDDYDPYYWSGLIFTGQNMVLEKENKMMSYTLIFIFSIIAILLIRKFFF